jgi:hypothetical protein
MFPQSRRLAEILLVVLPTVMYGGVTILWFLENDPELRPQRVASGPVASGRGAAPPAGEPSRLILGPVAASSNSGGC